MQVLRGAVSHQLQSFCISCLKVEWLYTLRSAMFSIKLKIIGALLAAIGELLLLMVVTTSTTAATIWAFRNKKMLPSYIYQLLIDRITSACNDNKETGRNIKNTHENKCWRSSIHIMILTAMEEGEKIILCSYIKPQVYVCIRNI